MYVPVSGQKEESKVYRHNHSEEQKQSVVTMVKILICGGENGAHVLSCVTSSKKDVQVNVLTVNHSKQG